MPNRIAVVFMVATLLICTYFLVKYLCRSKEKFVEGSVEVKFYYAPWCGHCKKFDPVWDGVSEELSEYASFEKIDSTVEPGKSRALEAGVNAFPHVVRIQDGETVEFKGPRTPENFKEFCMGQKV